MRSTTTIVSRSTVVWHSFNRNYVCTRASVDFVFFLYEQLAVSTIYGSLLPSQCSVGHHKRKPGVKECPSLFQDYIPFCRFILCPGATITFSNSESL